MFVAFGLVAYAVLTYAYPSECPGREVRAWRNSCWRAQELSPSWRWSGALPGARHAHSGFSAVSAVVIYLLWLKLNADARHAM